MLKFYLLLMIAVFSGTAVNAQNQPTSFASAEDLFKKFAIANNNSPQDGFYVAMVGQACKAVIPPPFARELGKGVFIVSAAHKEAWRQYSCIVKMSAAHDLWKLSPQLEWEQPTIRKQASVPMLFTVTATDIQALLNELIAAKSPIKIITRHVASQSAVIKCTPRFLFDQLLASHQLLFADIHYPPQTEVLLTGYDKSHNGINTLAYRLPFASGKGVLTGIKERSMDAQDIDLQQRIQPSVLAATEVEYHATSIATLIGGAGNSFYTGRGIAPQCTFFPSSFNNVFPDSSNLLLQKNINLQNHSYGTVKQLFYGAEAAAYDAQTFANKNLVHVFSSGNRGTEVAPAGTYNGLPGFANMTGNFKMAKNVLTIAALDTNLVLAPFSSSGPLYDGRLGPQLAAFGLNGTSDAAALVTGTATVLHQVYKDSNAQAIPPAALVKAILFNTADDVGAPGIDYRSGFGAINVYNAVLAMLKKQYSTASLPQNGIWTQTISLPAQAANLKVTLAWTDTAATVNNNTALINDLDVELIDLATGTVYKPWVLNPSPNVDSLNQLPVRKRDSLNTAEQISIVLPNAGQYQISVKATRVQTQQPQAFHVVWAWDTLNTFAFTSPLQAVDIRLEERSLLAIKWKTTLANPSATGNLSISYNNGSTWQAIATGLSLSSMQYKWLVKDTSAFARLKMECPFGTFFSNDFLIAPFTNIKVEFVCPDSVGIAWQKHPFATAYQLYVLPSDTAYLKPLALLADTVATLRNGQQQYNVVAVRPILGNGLPAAQSLAINIRNQAVRCFYNSFGAVNNRTTVDLQLLLSTIRGVDSVVFEKLNYDNTLQRILGGFRVTGNQLDYTNTDASPNAGLNVYRVGIRFMDGRWVYTDKVTVINTGQRQIYYYPNPVSSGSVLNYQLKDTDPGWQWQLVDMQGRVVRTQVLDFAGTIRLANLQAGIYMYRLLSNQSVIVETGKIIVKN
jgi:Subtilase family